MRDHELTAAPLRRRGFALKATRLVVSIAFVGGVVGCRSGAPATSGTPEGSASPAPRRVVHPDTAPATKSFMEANRMAGGAMRERKWALAASYMDEAERHAPSHPLVLAFIARLRAAAGDTASAIRALERLASIGLAGPMRRDSTLLGLLDSPRFAHLGTRLDSAARPIVASDTAFVIDQPDLLIEGIAHVPGRNDEASRFFVGSMSTGQILRVDVSGTGTPATVPFAVTSGRPLGMKVDRSGRLWVNVWAISDTADTLRVRKLVQTAKSELHLYDVKSGTLLRRLASPADTLAHQFNDLAITRSGDAYVTDTDGSRVFFVSPSTGTLSVFVSEAADLSYPNGIALSRDDKRLYVAHLEGLSMWDLKTRTRKRLLPPANAALTGIDGLYTCGNNGLVAIQQLAGFPRVSYFRLSKSGDAIIAAEILEQNHPAYAHPTTGTIAGRNFYYVATSEVLRHKPDGSLTPPTRTGNTLILRAPLGSRCD